ncbi:MAG: hypothetical protein HY457_03640 [Parcubacteria group bacterium]|nr:hypothetical protein [Parcubacteria group bacterium]
MFGLLCVLFRKTMGIAYMQSYLKNLKALGGTPDSNHIASMLAASKAWGIPVTVAEEIAEANAEAARNIRAAEDAIPTVNKTADAQVQELEARIAAIRNAQQSEVGALTGEITAGTNRQTELAELKALLAPKPASAPSV